MLVMQVNNRIEQWEAHQRPGLGMGFLNPGI